MFMFHHLTELGNCLLVWKLQHFSPFHLILPARSPFSLGRNISVLAIFYISFETPIATYFKLILNIHSNLESWHYITLHIIEFINSRTICRKILVVIQCFTFLINRMHHFHFNCRLAFVDLPQVNIKKTTKFTVRNWVHLLSSKWYTANKSRMNHFVHMYIMKRVNYF